MHVFIRMEMRMIQIHLLIFTNVHTQYQITVQNRFEQSRRVIYLFLSVAVSHTLTFLLLFPYNYITLPPTSPVRPPTKLLGEGGAEWTVKE
jgi:hypothetical protein